MSQDAAAPPVRVSSVLSRRDLTAVLTASPRSLRLRLRRAALLAVVALAVFPLLDTLTRGAPTLAGLVAGAALATVYVAFVLATPWLVGSRTGRQAGVGTVTEWTFTPDGVTVRSVHSENEFGWDRVEDVCRTPLVVAFVLRPTYGAMGFPAAAVDEAGFARIEQWWREGRDGAAGTRPATSPEAADSWGGPAWVDEVVVTGPMTVALLRRLNLAALPWSVKVVWGLVIALAGVPLLVQAVLDPSLWDVADGAALFVVVVFLVVLPGFYEVAVRRAVNRLSGGPTTWRATPEGLTMQTPLGRTTVPWSRVEAARDRRGVLVLRTARPRCPMGMPTARVVAADRERVVEWLAAGTAGRIRLRG